MGGSPNQNTPSDDVFYKSTDGIHWTAYDSYQDATKILDYAMSVFVDPSTQKSCLLFMLGRLFDDYNTDLNISDTFYNCDGGYNASWDVITPPVNFTARTGHQLASYREPNGDQSLSLFGRNEDKTNQNTQSDEVCKFDLAQKKLDQD